MIKEELPFETKRAIVKALVKKIIVHTHFEDGVKRFHNASVHAEFSFDGIKVINGTPVPVVIFPLSMKHKAVPVLH